MTRAGMALEGSLAQPKTGPEVTLLGLRQVRRFTQHHIGQVLQALGQAGRRAESFSIALAAQTLSAERQRLGRR